MKELIENVINWANERDLLKKENAPKQYLKIIEELGETCSAILKNDRDKIKDGLGDLQVTLIIYAKQLGMEYHFSHDDDYYLDGGIYADEFELIEDALWELTNHDFRQLAITIRDLCGRLCFTQKECLQAAWDEIKDRKGKTINGTFVKESDLASRQSDWRINHE